MKFGEEYTKYWASAVNKSVDGTVIAGAKEAKHFLDYFNIKRQCSVLDLGCSVGRMHGALSDYFDHIYGVDPDLFAVEKARLEPYVEVHQGTAEDTGFDSSFFDFVFCWAVFDVVDHAKGFKEANRILKSDGKLLFSGKNSNYYPDDVLAFKAEKNAFLKGFPGRFTNLDIVLKNLKTFGFVLEKLFIFPRRGDFGLLKYEKCIHNNDIAPVGYEYLIICHKVIDQPEAELPLSGALDDRYSITATRAALQAGQGNAKELFESIGIN